MRTTQTTATIHDDEPSLDSPALEAREPANEHVDPLFLARWSPRAFADEPVAEDELEALFEAARWAPSSYNEQPWRFVYATSDEDRERFAEALLEANRSWAADAPVLAFVLTKTTFDLDGRENPHAAFDAGAAWMSLALQARRLGLATHAMGGIDYEQAAEIVGADEEHRVLCAVAIGHPAPPETLPDELAEEDRSPSDRKPLDEIAHEGTLATPASPS